jgi:hypothetical protein
MVRLMMRLMGPPSPEVKIRYTPVGGVPSRRSAGKLAREVAISILE